MRKEWYIKVGEEPEGPYSKWDLKRDRRVMPYTLAWRVGMPNWLPIREIPELKSIFEDSGPTPAGTEPEEVEAKETPGPERILEMNQEPNYFYYILMALALIILIFLYFQYIR